MNRLSTWKPWQIDAAGAAVVVALFVAAFAVQIVPAWQARQRAAAQAVDLAAQDQKQQALERAAAGLREQQSALRRERSARSFALEPASAINDRLGRIADLAAENGLTVEALEAGDPKSFPSYSTVSVRMRGQGRYSDCSSFIAHLRETLPDVGVTSLQMTATSGKSGVEASIALELLWHTAPQPSAAPRR
jgi:Tfp pilus assembly protein PilO